MEISKEKAIYILFGLTVFLLFLGFYVYKDSGKNYVPNSVIEEQKRITLPKGY